MSKKKKKVRDLDVYDEELSSGNTDLLSEEELKILKAGRDEGIDRSTLPHYDNSDLAKAKRYAKKNKFTVIFVSLTVCMLLAVIAFLSFLFYMKMEQAPNKNDFVLTLGEEESVVKYKKAMKDGVLYLDAIPILKYAELTYSGSGETLKITCEDGTYVRLENGKEVATVNGERVKVGGKVLITLFEHDDKNKDAKKLECLLPFSFLERLFSHEVEKNSPSMYVSYSEQTNEILFHRISYKDSGKPLPISFSADRFDIIAETLS